MFVQAFLAQPSIEAFHHRIVCGLARSAEVQLNASFISPFVHHLADELAAVIGFDRWKVTANGSPVEAIGRISMTVAVRNGQWRIVSFHRSTMPN